MPDKFDPYREALVVETETVWPDPPPSLSGEAKAGLEKRLHAEPAQCGDLEYVRMHTGFCRRIVVTDDDLKRLGVGLATAD